MSHRVFRSTDELSVEVFSQLSRRLKQQLERLDFRGVTDPGCIEMLGLISNDIIKTATALQEMVARRKGNRAR